MLSKIMLGAAMAATASATVYVKEDFSSGMDNWVVSSWKQAEGEAGTVSVTAGDFYGDAEINKGLKTMDDARFYAVSTKFPAFSNEGKKLVIQFSVKHEQNIDCGGGYMKIFPSTVDQAKLQGGADEDTYNIMFGPDICGTGTKKVHVIFNYKGKNLLTNKNIPCESDQLTHVYTLIVDSDNTYEVLVDGASKAKGALADDWDFLKPKEIKDPDVSKPKDWVDQKKIDDPEDVKPEGYDDIPAQITDPEATKPEDWDDEDDGEWEAPMIDNPEFKGEWKAKKIDNPDYKGEWVHPMIANPEFEDDPFLYKYDDFGVAAFEVWQVKAGTVFDNVIITDDPAEAEAFMKETFEATKDAEKKAFDDAEEAKRKADEEAAAAAAEEDDDAEDDEDEDDEDSEERKAKLEELKKKAEESKDEL